MNKYPVALVGGEGLTFINDLLTRICVGEEVGTDDDAFWAAGLLKYGLVERECHNGAHFDSFLNEIGYEKKGGVSNAK